MSYNIVNGRIEQTGTDTSLFGIENLSSAVTTFSYLGKTFFTVDNTLGFSVDGNLSWDNSKECLIIEKISSNSQSNFRVSETGVCVIGLQLGIVNNKPYYTEGVGLILSSNGPNFFATRHIVAGSLTFNGGEFHYGSVLGNGTTNGQIIANSTILRKIQIDVESNILRNDSRPGDVQFNNVKLQSNGVPIYLFSRNGLTTFTGAFENATIQTRAGEHTGALTLNNLIFANNTADVDLVFNGSNLNNQAQATEITNIDVGSAIRFANTRFAHLALFQEVKVNVINLNFEAIENAKLFLRTTNSGNRLNSTRPDALQRYQNFKDYQTFGLDNGSTDLYELISDVNGEFDLLKILTARFWNNLDGVTITDLYNKSQIVGQDNFDLKFISYINNISIIELTLNRSEIINQITQLTSDLNITNFDTSIVSNYYELQTPFKLYDFLKLYLFNNYNGELNTIVDRSSDTINLNSYNLNIYNTETEEIFNINDNNINIIADSFVGSFVGTSNVTLNGSTRIVGDVENDLILNDTSTISNGNFNKVILSATFNPTNVILDNVNINEIENLTDNAIELTLINSSIEQLTPTNGTLTIPQILNIIDFQNEETKCIVWDADNVVDGQEIYSYNNSLNHIVNVSGISRVRIAIDKPAYYAKIYELDISSDATINETVILTPSPNVDLSVNIDELTNATTTEIVEDVIGPFDAFVATINSDFDKISAAVWRRYHDFFTETKDGLTILGLFNLNGDNVYETTISGVNILSPSIQVKVANTQKVSTVAFVNLDSALAVAPIYEYLPRNSNNVKVETSLINPLIDYDLVGQIVRNETNKNNETNNIPAFTFK